MHSRFLASWRGVLLATVFASLIVASFSTIAAAPKQGPTATVPGASDGGLTVVGQETNPLRRTLYPRTNYEWPYATGPYYGGKKVKPAVGILRTDVGSFDLESGRQLPIPAMLTEANRLGELGMQYFVVQMDVSAFDEGGFDAFRQAVEAAGGALVQPVPTQAYIARLTPGAFDVAESSAGVVAVEPYHPAFKLNPWIGRVALPDPFKAQSEVYDLEVMLHEGEDSAAVASALAAMGGNVLSVLPKMVRVEMHRSHLVEIARMQPVYRVVEHTPVFPMAEETTNTMQIGSYCDGSNCGPIPYHKAGIRGGGNATTGAFTLMVLDTGIQIDAGELSDTKTDAGSPDPTLHRKVKAYESTNQFGGNGDLLGCDASSQGAFTHGHTVAATALGWATDIDAAYDPGLVGFTAPDPVTEKQWKLDGVAPEAKLVGFDMEVTPSLVSCDDPSAGGLQPGTLYDGTPGSNNGSLSRAYTAFGALDSNHSWGTVNNPAYTSGASQIDEFIDEQRDAMVFMSAGNDGSDDDADGIKDPNSVSSPSTCKNCLVIGSTGNADDLGANTANSGPEAMSFFSSVGPATDSYPADGPYRIAPHLMAPGQERGSMGIASEFSCRTTDNDQNNPVQCDLVTGVAGTSFSSPAAAGAGLLVRDYFAKGFYPDGTDQNPNNAGDEVDSISGALLKAVLTASADWVGVGNNLPSNGSIAYRANREQGFGRIQLDKALPLQSWGPSPIGLIVEDGGDGVVSSLGLTQPLSGTTSTSTTFTVSDVSSELAVVLAWNEAAGEFLTNDLDLEITSPGGKTYYGNYFTDDNNRSGAIEAGEDCPGFDGTAGEVDASPWSLPTCVNSIRDTDNVIEAIYLSPDPDGNGNVNDGLSQLEAGDWTITVSANGVAGSQTYAVAIAGGVAVTSSVRLNKGLPVCNDNVQVIVSETDETDDPGAGLTPAEVAGRTTIKVFSGGVEVDSESGSAFAFTQDASGGLRFTSEPIILTDGTAYDPGNGALDIQDGDEIRVVYADESNGAADPNQERTSSANVSCSTTIGFGNLTFALFGRDTITFVDGGCEVNERGSFEYGFPDQYLDDGELVSYAIAFFNDEALDLLDAEANLRCVVPDGNNADDPGRLDNAPCTGVSILDSPKVLGDIPAGAAIAAKFTVEVSGAPSNDAVEMVLGVKSPTAGKPAEGYAVAQARLNADQSVAYYSTDFPSGGSEVRDYDNDEIAGVTESIADAFFLDYRIESRTWGNLNSTGKNGGLGSPWNFNSTDGNFKVGITSGSDTPNQLPAGNVIVNWGEDLNFNGILDAGEDRDPRGSGGILDKNWNTNGGCGWNTTGPDGRGGANGAGAWHTGSIGTKNNRCLVTGTTSGQCEQYSIITGNAGERFWWESLETPIINKVSNDPDVILEHINFAWNMQVQLEDQFALLTWEVDTDTESATETDLRADGTVFNLFGGPAGPIGAASNPGLFTPYAFGSAQEGYPVFAQVNGSGVGFNGTVGNNRAGALGCYFEGDGSGAAGPLDPAGKYNPVGPPDDDLDNDGDGTTDEFVSPAGPIRNSDLTIFNGPDLRFTTLEDIYGDSEATFAGAFGFAIVQPDLADDPAAGTYGVALDDVVWEWKEISVIPDGTTCTGECATLNLDVTNFYEGSAILNLTLTEKTPPADNDCDLDGVTDATVDCDGDGVRDIPIETYNDDRQDTEIIFLNQVGSSNLYKGAISISATADVDAPTAWGDLLDPSDWIPGSLFVQRVGTNLPTVFADYRDDPAECNNDLRTNARGLISEATTVLYPVGRLTVQTFRFTDNGDNDGFADTNETVQMYVTLSNNSGADLSNVVARISTNDPSIEYVSQATSTVPELLEGAVLELPDPFEFKVRGDVNRAGAFDDFAASITVAISTDQFAGTVQPQIVEFDLDLDITSGGGVAQDFTEGFEVASGFGQFTSMTLDATTPFNNTTSDGKRCQFNDPDFENANSFGNADCFLEHPFNPFFGSGPYYDWHIHDGAVPSSAPDGGRAYLGTRSLHIGVHAATGARDDTTRLAQLDAVRTINPVHLGLTGAPELTFKQQISIVDDRTVNVGQAETPDKAVVMIQLANNAGTATGNWIKIAPYKNVYDRQGTDNYFECMFDPIDDGSTEDDFFDPTDPDRRLGPSSTCYPEFVFAFLGDTDYRNTFNVAAIGRASDGPGLQGSIDRGTWVESAFNLSRYKGRSFRMRFLYTSIQVTPGVPTIEDLFDLPFDWTGDDGWYIDDVRVTGAVSVANNVQADGKDNSGLPSSGNCSAVTTVLSSARDIDGDGMLEPTNSTPAPGHVIQLSAADSSANTCLNGVLQYAFYLDDGNGVIGDAGDTQLRGFTDTPVLEIAPQASGTYGVVVRCSSKPDCPQTGSGNDSVFIDVTCPASGNLGFSQTVLADNKTQFSWNTAATVDAVRGDLGAVRSGGSFTGTVAACVLDNQSVSSFAAPETPASGQSFYWLVRGSEGGAACNAVSTYGNSGSGLRPGRDDEIAADANACP